VPWYPFWDRNWFIEALPRLEHVLASPFVRGGVSGVGAITVVAGLLELAAAFGARRREREQAPSSSA
jgi:hypothetical protein